MGHIFDWVLRTQIIKGARGGHAHFPPKSDPKSQNQRISMIAWIFHDQSIDNTLRNFTKIQPNSLKNNWVMAKEK